MRCLSQTVHGIFNCRSLLITKWTFTIEILIIDCSSPADVFWVEYLTDGLHSFTDLKEVFQPFLDHQEYFQKQNFSIIHQVVLELVPLDLEQQHRITISEIDFQSSDVRTALYWACLRSNLPKVIILLKYGADDRIVAGNGWNALHAAAYGTGDDSFKTVKALIHHFCEQHLGSDALLTYVNAIPGHFLSPLTIAVWRKHTCTLKLLIDHNADANFAGSSNTTPLLRVIQYNHPPSILMLKRECKRPLHG